MRSRVEASLDRTVAGRPDRVRQRVDSLVEHTGADELMASTSTYDLAALRESDRLLRELVA